MRARIGPAHRKCQANCFMMTLIAVMTMLVFLFGNPYLGTPRRLECELMKTTGLVWVWDGSHPWRMLLRDQVRPRSHPVHCTLAPTE